ncbi:MAG: hypothetical protein R2747_22045 [Pyrinomonadaceae bacterium]
MKKSLLLIFLSLSTVSVSAQEKCLLPLSEAPSFFNLTLGMSGPQAKTAVGGKLNIKDKSKGVYFQNFIKHDPPRNLSGVRAIYLRFFDSKLYQIEVFYEKGSETPLEELVDQLSARENLPRSQWEIKYGIARLTCEGFSVGMDNFLNPRIEVTDPALLAEFTKSRGKK